MINWKTVALELICYLVNRDKCQIITVLKRAEISEDQFEIMREAMTDRKIRNFHKTRRMFFIKPSGDIILSYIKTEDGHKEWAKKLKLAWSEVSWKWCRGFYHAESNAVYFYSGEQAQDYEFALPIFRLAWPKLKASLTVTDSVRLFGGMEPGEPGTLWKPVRDFTGQL